MRRALFVLIAVIGTLLPAGLAAADEPSVRVLARLDGPLDVVLDDLAAGDVEVDRLRSYGAIPWIAAELPADDVAVLRASDAVASVVADTVVDVDLAQSVPLINADDTTAAGFGGSGQRVAILDTGVESSHPALAGKVVAEACFSAGADCPGGLTSSTGAGSAAPCAYAVSDCYHGTHVAGIAAGVAPSAQIVAVQVFSDFGNDARAYTSDVAAGLTWIYNNRSTLGVAAANLSLGGDTLYTDTCDASSSMYASAISLLRGVEIATTVSAGNAGSATSMSSPACVSTAVSVGSTTKADAISGFSNRSPVTSVMAPGSSIYAPLLNGSYGHLSGTSMAAPHVAGAWAQLKSAAPAATVAQVLTALQTTGATISGTAARRIDVLAALGSLVPTPSAPRSLAATTGDGTLSFSWTAPAWTGTSALTGYRVTVDGVSTDLGPATTTHALTGLPNGTPETLTVVALNGGGAGTGTSLAATPAALPAAPTITGATAANRSATVTWTAPSDTGGPGVALTGYRVTSSPGGLTAQVAGTATSGQVTGLTNGTPYTFTVEALNTTGASPASAASSAVTPAAVAPGAPTAVTASAGDGSVAVSWTAPADDGGSPIVEYVVTPSSGSPATTTALSTSFAVANGTSVSFSVIARNAVGDSPASASSTVVPAAPTTTTTAAPAPAPVISGGGGGGFSPAPAPTTTSTTAAPTTTTTTPRPTTTTTTPPPAAPPSPGAAVGGGVIAVRDGVPVVVPVPTTQGHPVVAGAATPSGDGAWTVTADGAVHTSGDARDLGDLAGVRLNKPLVGMAPTATGRGYWLLASDGGIFTFGDARFMGSTGAIRLNQPITTMAATPTGRGYWLLARDGGVFTFGDARFMGSTGAMRLNQPVVGMAPTPTGRGYWLVAGDGGIFTFGDARFAGAGAGGRRIVAMAPSATGRGYWLLASDRTALPFGDAGSTR